MGLRIGSNVAAMAAGRNLGEAQRQAERSMRALASGKRIVSAGDDAAGFAVGETLRGQASGLKQSKKNADNAVSFIQVAEGGLNEQNNILVRLRELAVQAASDTIGDREREFLQLEFSELVSEFDRIAHTTQFGSNKLLVGDEKTFSFQLGANSSPENVVEVTLKADTTADNYSLNSLDIQEIDDARDALEDLDVAVTEIAGVRASFGAIQSRLMTARDNLAIQEENITAAHSKIVDADIAEEVSNLTSANIKQDFAVSVLAQANQRPAHALKLIG